MNGDCCTTDHLDWPHVRDRIGIIERAQSADERRVVDALLGFVRSLDSMEHGGGIPAGRVDRAIMDEALGAVHSMSDALVERFALPAVYMAKPPRDHVGKSRRKLKQRRRAENAFEAAWKRLTWKPLDRLWTSPLFEPASGWAVMLAKMLGHVPWDRQLRYESPPRASRVVVDSLASADELIGENSFEELARRLEGAGIKRIDFSWRCVLEAECSLIRGEREGGTFPCGLGTESSVWLAAPVLIGEAPVPTLAELGLLVVCRGFDEVARTQRAPRSPARTTANDRPAISTTDH